MSRDPETGSMIAKEGTQVAMSLVAVEKCFSGPNYRADTCALN